MQPAAAVRRQSVRENEKEERKMERRRPSAAQDETNCNAREGGSVCTLEEGQMKEREDVSSFDR